MGTRSRRDTSGHLHLFAVGLDNALYHAFQSAPGSWNSAAPARLGSTAISDPAVAQHSDGRLNVFFLGPVCDLQQCCETSAGAPAEWTAIASLAGQSVGAWVASRS